jgi:hypothetical protein
MLLEGIIRNGIIVLDRPQTFPEATRVRISVEPTEEDCRSLRGLLLKHAGTATGLPSDLAKQHDHCIHGTPNDETRLRICVLLHCIAEG